MRNLLILLVITFTTSLSGYSQYYVDYGISAGASNYLGEFGGGEGEGRGFIADMEFSFTRWTVGGFYRYRISPRIALKASFNYIKVAGDDVKSDNPARRARNLNFKNDLYEFLVNTEFFIYKVNDVGGTGRYRTDFNLYLFAGVGAFYSNPKGQEAKSGEWVSLRPLQSEGKSYSSISMAIPMGIGFYYTLDNKYRIGMEIGYRTTFTDYIDDASTFYATNYDGITNKTTPELLAQINAENGNVEGDKDFLEPRHFQIGGVRGGSSNDGYMTMTVNFSWAIRGRSKFYKARYSWLHNNKRRNRRSRPKF